MNKDEKKNAQAAGTPAAKPEATPVQSSQVQKVLSMLDDGCRFKNVNPDALKALASKSVQDLFGTPEGRLLLHSIPNKITVIREDESETQVPVFTNPELMAAGKLVVDEDATPIPHYKHIKSKKYVSAFDIEIPPNANDEEKEAIRAEYAKTDTSVIELPLIDPKAKDGDTVLLNAKEAWQQWNRGQGNKKKKRSASKSKTATDPIAYCDKMIAAAKTDVEKKKWEDRKLVFAA